MLLEGRSRNLLGDAALEGLHHCLGLCGACGEENAPARLQQRRDADGDGLLRHRLGAEARPVRGAGRFAEGDDPGSRIEGGARFVEGDVAVATDPKQREIDSARVGDGAFVGGCGRVEIALRRRWRVRALGRQIDVLE